MTTEQFTYWLQGFMEVANPTTLDETQTQIIKDHLALVFNKQTPNRNTLPDLDFGINNPITNPTLNYNNDLDTTKICTAQETIVVEPHFFGGKKPKKVGKVTKNKTVYC